MRSRPLNVTVRTLMPAFALGLLSILPISLAIAEGVETREPLNPTTGIQFRHGSDGFGRNLAVVVTFLAIFGAAGFVAIRYGRGRLPGGLRAGSGSDIRLVEVRRIAPRLTIYRIDLGNGRQATIADNGNTLLLLDQTETDIDRGGDSHA